MKALFPILLMGTLFSGCESFHAGKTPHEFLLHDIPIPREYRGGDPWPNADGSSKRYSYAYESGWWACIEQFAANIEHKVESSDRYGNGWPEAVRGYEEGYRAAEARVAKLIRLFGRDRTQAILKATLDAPTQ